MRLITPIATFALCCLSVMPSALAQVQPQSQSKLTPSQIAIQITQVVNGWAQGIETLQQQNQQLHDENEKLKSENEELKKKLAPEK